MATLKPVMYDICEEISKMSNLENSDVIDYDVGPDPCLENKRVFAIIFKIAENLQECDFCKSRGANTPEHFNKLVDFCLLTLGEPGSPLWPTISTDITTLSDDQLEKEIKRVVTLLQTILLHRYYRKSNVDWYNLDRQEYLNNLKPSSLEP